MFGYIYFEVKSTWVKINLMYTVPQM